MAMSQSPRKGGFRACCRGFWERGDDIDPNSPPIAEAEIRKREEKNGRRLPVSLAKAQSVHNGGQVRGTDLVIAPLESFSVLDYRQGPKPKVLAMHDNDGGVFRDESCGTLAEFIEDLRR